MLTDRTRHGKYVAQIRAAVFVRRRANGDKNDLCMCNRVRSIGGEAQRLARAIGGNDILQARLVDRNLACVQTLDLVRVDIDTDHIVADIRNAGTGDETDVSGSKNTDPHQGILLIPARYFTGSEPRQAVRRSRWRKKKGAAAKLRLLCRNEPRFTASPRPVSPAASCRQRALRAPRAARC